MTKLTYQSLYLALRTCCILALEDRDCGSPDRALQRIEDFLEDLEKHAPLGYIEEQEAFSITIQTDGACTGNPGPGGWGYTKPDGSLAASGHIPAPTTNNRAELLAIYHALEFLNPGTKVTIQTDSRNAVGWLADGWKRNVADIRVLCQEIEAVVKNLDLAVTYEHIPREENEAADKLAKNAIRR